MPPSPRTSLAGPPEEDYASGRQWRADIADRCFPPIDEMRLRSVLAKQPEGASGRRSTLDWRRSWGRSSGWEERRAGSRPKGRRFDLLRRLFVVLRSTGRIEESRGTWVAADDERRHGRPDGSPRDPGRRHRPRRASSGAASSAGSSRSSRVADRVPHDAVLRHAGRRDHGADGDKRGARVYFDVDDINAGTARVGELGGDVRRGDARAEHGLVRGLQGHRGQRVRSLADRSERPRRVDPCGGAARASPRASPVR